MFAAATAINGTGYNSMQKQMTADFSISQSVFLLGNVLYLSIGVAFTPLLLAPLSEIFGRLPIFLVSALLFALLYIPAALTHSFAGFLVVRLLQGCVASVGNSMVGGTVSDIFPAAKRGLPMSTFALSIYMGQAVGPFTASYTVNNPALGWRWAFGWQGILCGLVFALMALSLRETRGSVLLSRRAAKLTAQDENGRQYRCSADDDRVSFWKAVKVSLSRPAWWLISEPVVTSFSLWIGFLWGCVFLLLESVPIVFQQYGWTDPQQALVILTLGVGAFLAWLANFYQEKIYARVAAKAAPQKAAPEARLYFACVGGCLAPIGFFIFAWTGRPGINPAAPIIGLVIFAASTFWIYLAVFTYLAECYEIYASSGLAAQSWLRNLLAGIFPLFAPAMYHKLQPPVASTILGAIAAVLGACPFILFFFGRRIRAKSRVAQALAKQEEARRIKMERERQRNSRRQERDLHRLGKA
jgi:MFS family permease